MSEHLALHPRSLGGRRWVGICNCGWETERIYHYPGRAEMAAKDHATAMNQAASR